MRVLNLKRLVVLIGGLVVVGVTVAGGASANSALVVAPGATCVVSTDGVIDQPSVAYQIPDDQTNELDASMTVSGAPAGSTIWDVEAGLATDHTYTGDLRISLESPAGTTIWLSYEEGQGAIFGTAFFDDEAATAISAFAASSTPLADNVRPEEALSSFRGQGVNGVWHLHLYDKVTGDTGSLIAWAIRFSMCQPPAAPPQPPPAPDTVAPAPPSLSLTGPGRCGTSKRRACKGPSSKRLRFSGKATGDGTQGAEVDVILTEVTGPEPGKKVIRSYTVGANGTFTVTTGRNAMTSGRWTISASIGGQKPATSKPLHMLINGRVRKAAGPLPIGF